MTEAPTLDHEVQTSTPRPSPTRPWRNPRVGVAAIGGVVAIVLAAMGIMWLQDAARLRSDREPIEAAITDRSATLADLEGRISALESELSATDAAIVGARSDLEALASEEADLTARYGAADAGVRPFALAVIGLEADMLRLAVDLDDATAEFDRISQAIAAAVVMGNGRNLDAMQGALTGVGDRLDEVADLLEACTDQITTLTRKANALRGNVPEVGS